MNSEQYVPYYAKSAADYDLRYNEEACQDDLHDVHQHLAIILKGHTVLELACGTGYWTETLADVADKVVAIDISPEMIEQAHLRELPDDIVQFRVADAYDLPADLGDFTAVFIGCWWSHVKREHQEKFLAHVKSRVGKDVMLVLLDDDYVEGISPTVARTDSEGNTYQILAAPDGERYDIPKTYPSDSALRKKLASSVREIKISRNEFYWILTCRLK